jgi:thioredoxin reductase
MSVPSKHIAILGAGPVGLEAALAAVERGLPFTVYEAASEVGGSLADWGHVRMFTPWELNVSPRARRFLAAAGKPVPAGAGCPTGRELRRELLTPLAELPAVAPHLRLGTRALAVGRQGLLKHEEIASPERARRPFRLLVDDHGRERIEAADVVLDATGSYAVPNTLGDGGIPAPGETALDGAIGRRIPDLAHDAEAWAGRTILLVGSGHSAQTAARDLAALALHTRGTRVLWVVRAESPAWGAVPNDPLPERLQLAASSAALAAGASPAVEVRRGEVIERLEPVAGRVAVTLRRGDGRTESTIVDRLLALTGSVGDHTLYRQLQVHECYATSGPMNLSAALLGAAGGDCLAQTSHGAAALVNPEPGFFLLGSKSYGRNTTFLMRNGWAQVDEVFGLLEAAG